MNKKTITVTAEISVYFAPGDRVRLKHLPAIKGTVVRLSSWHGYNDVVIEDGKPTKLHVTHYDIKYDKGGGIFTSSPENSHELDVD